MRTPRILVIVLLSGVWVSCALRSGATTYHSDGSEASVQSIIDTQAQAGDTITMPVGIFDWTTELGISKASTFQGQTTVSGAGTATPTINDGTIIRDAGWTPIMGQLQCS